MHVFLKYLLLTAILEVTLPALGCKPGYPEPNRVTPGVEKEGDGMDALDIIYRVAEEKGMRVIADLNMNGGELYKKHTLEYVNSEYKKHIPLFYKRYGKYKSFWGWYLNNELNPLKPDEVTNSTYWRKAWKAAVSECKRVAPKTVVTISPFFLLDKNAYRGFEYLQPIVYEQWWAKTLAETGIDILMLQDSGAEHLGFFTLEDRRPFFQAFKNACEQAGSKLWLNVETGEVDARDWEDAIQMERSNTQKWVYTKTEWLAQKLALAAEFGDNIVNWGYYPYMNPALSAGPYLSDNTPADIREANYTSYKDYVTQELQKPAPPAGTPSPLLRGTLWWLPANYAGFTKEKLEATIREQIDYQAAIGFDILWIVNAPGNMQWAIDQEK